MSTVINSMVALIKRQEEQRKELAAGAHEAWQSIKENEDKLLEAYDGKYENASEQTQEKINKHRQKYFDEWGSDGKLAVLMAERHAKEREKLANDLAQKQIIMDRLKRDRDRHKDKDRER